MNGRWKMVIIYPYTTIYCLIQYKLTGYNFAFIDCKLQMTNNKYICDVGLLKNGKYNRQQMFLIADSLGLAVRKNISNNKLYDAIYKAM